MDSVPKTGGGAGWQSHPVGHRGPDAVDRLVAGLEHLAGQPPQAWRAEFVDRLALVRTLLAEESPGPADWLQSRRSMLLRERNALLDRITATRLGVLAADDVDRVIHDVQRLAACVRRHLQKVSDVAWDEVEFEVGGSE